MTNFKAWLKACRLPFLTATLIPVLFGVVYAWHDTGSLKWSLFFLTFIGVAFIHIGTNLTNDYYDHKSGNDANNQAPTPFSGGSRVIQDGCITPKKILCAALTFFTLGVAIGLYLNSVRQGNIILFLGLAGCAFGFFYTADPIRIGYRGFGELVVGLGFGPIVITGAYYVQAQSLSGRVPLVSIPIAILIALVVYINEFPDYVADKSVNKQTLVVKLGKKKAIVGYYILLCATYVSVLLLMIVGYLPWACLVTFLTLPVVAKIVLVSSKNFDKIEELSPANAGTIGLHLLVGLLLCAGLVLDKVF